MVLSPMSRKTFKYRLYPNRQQQERLQTTLNICRELYNAGLQERIESYQTTGKGTTFNSQSAQLPDIKTIREDVGKVFSQVLQDVLHRLDKTYASFFLRVKRHQKAGRAQNFVAIAFPTIPQRVETPILSMIKRRKDFTVLGLIPIRVAISFVVRPPSERYCKTSCSRVVR